MADPICLSLSGAVLPDTMEPKRRHARKGDRQTPHYLETYDRSTLFYDCVYQEDAGHYLFTAPRFLNLWAEFRDRIRYNGEPVRDLKRRRTPKYEQVLLSAPLGEMALDLPGGAHPIVPRLDISDMFAGLNAVVTMNKDNDLSWVRDWLLYLVTQHGLEAVLIFDNGSRDYPLEALADAMAGVDGIKAAAVVLADFPYGPRDSGQGFELRPKFLQPAVINIARTDILRKSRAVLGVDIDEVVLRRGGDSVFDRAVKTWAGAVKIRGAWAYPSADDPLPCGHGKHINRIADDHASPKKWCAVPQGRLSRLGWFVHHVGGSIFQTLPTTTDCEFVHCRATSTGWKGSGRYALPDGLERDPELVTLMAQYFET
ncbi:MAG: hypothetical protein AAGF71_14720 [Pseudomonadota bacterium]